MTKRPFNREAEREVRCSIPNRKKVRGWPRRLQELDRLRARNMVVDVERLSSKGTAYDYAKLYLDPFYRLEKRNPRWWFRRLCVAALVDIAEAWRGQLTVLDRPVMLELWIGHPNFLESQVVAATGSRIERYDVAVPVCDHQSAALPNEIRWPGDPLDKFEWRAAVDIGFDDDENPINVGTIWRGTFKR